MQLPQALHHFFVGQVLVRDASAEVQNLPERNCESPHIALGRILSLKIICDSLSYFDARFTVVSLNKLSYLDIRWHTVEITYRITYEKYWFPSHPSYWQRHSSIDFVVIASVQFVVRAEVRDFDMISFTDQTISANKIMTYKKYDMILFLFYRDKNPHFLTFLFLFYSIIVNLCQILVIVWANDIIDFKIIFDVLGYFWMLNSIL